MKLAALSTAELGARLKGPGVLLQTGPVVVRIQSPLAAVREGLATLYAGHPLVEDGEGFVDFHIRLDRPAGLRRWYRPQALFYLDDHPPFKPLPLSQAFPMLEWGLNWCMATYLNQYLMLHAAVVERGGMAVILPGAPGAGKSTLCAALVGHGWRLFSDEMAMISLADGLVYPNPRPISLKNESIAVIRGLLQGAVLGAEYEDTRKGTVGHLRPPPESVARSHEPAPARYVIAPRYKRGAAGRLVAAARARMFMTLVDNAFNYSVLGGRAFTVLADVLDACACYHFEYEDLEQALAVFSELPVVADG